MGRNDIPLRRADGSYRWCHFQRRILKKYDRMIREIQQKLRELKSQLNRLLHEKEIYRSPVEELDRIALEEKEKAQKKLEETNFELSQTHEEKNQLKEELTGFGIKIDEKSSAASGDESNRTGQHEWWMRHVFSFLGIWFLCEVLLTAVQWMSLRDILSIEEVLTRSLEIGILILFFKIIAYRREKNPRRIYAIYMAINISLILVMIFVPPILHFSYEVGHPAVSTSDWSISDVQESGNQTDYLGVPAWVIFYWNHQWIPAVLGLIFAIVVLFGLKPSRTEDENEQRVIDNFLQMPVDEQNEIENTYRSLVQKEDDLTRTRAELENRIKELERTPDDMISILEILESLHTKQLNIENEIERLRSELDVLVDDILLELDEFKNEFTRLLQNDNVRRQLTVNLKWPARDDVLNYFNIKNLQEVHDE